METAVIWVGLHRLIVYIYILIVYIYGVKCKFRQNQFNLTNINLVHTVYTHTHTQ